MSKKAFPKKIFVDGAMIQEGGYFIINNEKNLNDIADDYDLPMTLAEYQLVGMVTVDRTVTMKPEKGKK